MNEWTEDERAIEQHNVSWQRTETAQRMADEGLGARAAVRWPEWIERCVEAEALLGRYRASIGGDRESIILVDRDAEDHLANYGEGGT